MDLTSAITNFQTATLSSKIQYAVARKALDQQQASGDAAVKLIEAAGKGFNQAGDALAVAATGLGGNLDTVG